jgi:protein SERAC1
MPFWKRQRQTTLDPAPAGGLSSSFEHNEEPTDTAQYGMIMVRDKPSEAPKMLDVVAIHGLNGHYQKTWTETTSPRKVNWLQDLLPEQLPNARIMSYSYNSAVAFSKATIGIKTFAEQLLEDLMAWRLTLCEQERPIIFICHSLGGIVFKQVFATIVLRAVYHD